MAGCGRKKTDMKKMEDKNKRMVTFTKRRGTLFGKATELCISCGTEIGIIAYSPNGNPFVFDSSSVLRRFVGPMPTSGALPLEKEHSSSSGYEDRQLMKANYVQWEKEALSTLDKARKKAAAAERNEEKPQSRWWEEDPSENLEEDELEFYIEQLEKLGDMVKQRAQVISKETTTSDPMPTCCNVVPYDGYSIEEDPMTVFDASNAAREGIEKEVTLASDDFDRLLEYEFDFGDIPLWS